MAEKDPTPPPEKSDRTGQGGKPRTLGVRGPLVGVLIGELREIVVAGVRVAAAAIRAPRGQGLIIIPRDRDDPEFVQDRIDLPGVGAESAQVAEAEDRGRAAPKRVLRDRAKGEVVAVRATEERQCAFETPHDADGITRSREWLARDAGRASL